jgi:hypothetical protein
MSSRAFAELEGDTGSGTVVSHNCKELEMVCVSPGYSPVEEIKPQHTWCRHLSRCLGVLTATGCYDSFQLFPFHHLPALPFTSDLLLLLLVYTSTDEEDTDQAHLK